MKLVTFQTLDALNDLKTKGYLECDENKINIEKAGPIYKWVIDNMNKKMVTYSSSLVTLKDTEFKNNKGMVLNHWERE